MSVIFPITYFLLLATFGGLVLERVFLWLNRSVWAEDPSNVPSDERLMAAWGLSLAQAVLIGLVMGAMNALHWQFASTLFVASPVNGLIGDVTIVIAATAITVPPMGLALEWVLRLSLGRSMLLAAFQVTVFSLITAATVGGLLVVTSRS